MLEISIPIILILDYWNLCCLENIGEQFIRGKDNIIKCHFGQVAKKYLQDKETKGKDENKQWRAWRTLEKGFCHVSVPTDRPSKKVKLLLDEKISLG